MALVVGLRSTTGASSRPRSPVPIAPPPFGVISVIKRLLFSSTLLCTPGTVWGQFDSIALNSVNPVVAEGFLVLHDDGKVI